MQLRTDEREVEQLEYEGMHLLAQNLPAVVFILPVVQLVSCYINYTQKCLQVEEATPPCIIGESDFM